MTPVAGERFKFLVPFKTDVQDFALQVSLALFGVYVSGTLSKPVNPKTLF